MDVIVGDDQPRRLTRRGYSCLYASEAKALLRYDALVRECVTRIVPEEWHVSSLIDEDDLVRCGFISAFPSQLTVAAVVSPASFQGVVEAGQITEQDLSHRRKHLTPAACLNIYPMLGLLRRKENCAITTLTSVFRHEEAGFEDLTRMWEFKVREFVFAGDQRFVTDMLDCAVAAAVDLARRLQLAPRIENASDHFYPNRENTIRQKMQLQLAFKRELVVEVAGRPLALASFNFHGTHFSAPYQFDNGNRIVTGCVGFGLHRWLATQDPASVVPLSAAGTSSTLPEYGARTETAR
jgi:seryl-tRNA synthetase